MIERADFLLTLSKSMVVGAILIAFAVAFVPPMPAAPNGAGEALFARFIFWAAIAPLALLINSRARGLRRSANSSIQRRRRQVASMAVVCATLLLWDVVATTIYFLGWAGLCTSVFVLGVSSASALLGLFFVHRHSKTP